MLQLTDVAQTKIREVIASDDDLGNLMRVSARKLAPYRFDYDIHFIETDELGDEDVQTRVGELVLVVDPASAANLEGATIDYVEGPPGGFKFDNPNAKPSFDDPIEIELNEFIEAAINPRIAAHGGFISLHGIEDDVVYLEMGGGCQGCGMAAMTLREGVEKEIRQRFPTVRDIVDVTNHDEGENPFYARR